MPTNEEVARRITTWNTARDMVQPIVAIHGLEEYRSGAPFGQQSTFTKVDQHLDHIMHVADWLLEKEG